MPKRRGHGDGAIYQRESDKLWVAYARYQGKRRYVYSKTRAEVAQKLKALQKDIDARTLVTASKTETVESYLAYWLDIRKGRKDIKASTVNTQADHLKMVYPYIGRVKLSKLTADQVQQMCNRLLDTYKASTIHTVLTTLASAFGDAIRWQRLSYNPCKDVQLPIADRHEGPVLTPGQAQSLLNAAKGTAIECFVIMALATGMRRGELLALHWSDVDLDTRLLKVSRTASYLPDETGKYRFTETPPKTQSGKRSVRIAQFAINALKLHKLRQTEHRLQAADWTDTGLVFPNRKGTHYAFSHLDRQFKKLLLVAGLPEMRIHDLRHSSATLLLSQGVPLKVVQEILGHSNFSITMNVYGHVLETQKDEAANTLDALFLLAQ